MSDQAATLRVIRGGDKTSGPIKTVPPRCAIAVSGGKGGVGKSTVALNLAITHARMGARTLIVDTDLGMADLNLLLGVAPERNVLDALGGASIEDVLQQAHGISLLPALNGSYVLSNLGPSAQGRILEMIGSLASRFDTLVVDIAAGIGQIQTTFASATADTLIVVNPEPLSMADAYAALKVLSTEQGVKHAYIVPNRVISRAQADEVVARLSALVHRFLDLEVTALPYIPADPSVSESAQIGVPLAINKPDSPAARAIRQIVRVLGAKATNTNTNTETSWFRTAASGGSR
ncbi:MAG: P-loop NTPase [Kofleriaceae bacterium]